MSAMCSSIELGAENQLKKKKKKEEEEDHEKVVLPRRLLPLSFSLLPIDGKLIYILTGGLDGLLALDGR